MVRPWVEMSDYIALRRVGGLLLSPDGGRLIAPVSEPGPDGTAFGTALWEIDPGGERAARRITRSAAGEAGPAFLPDGSLLFTSARPDAESTPENQGDAAALWLLPAGGGEARRVAARPGGFSGVATADDGTVAFLSALHPDSADDDADTKARKARADAKVSAILHESSPVRSWDHDVGPTLPRLFTAAAPADGDAGLGAQRDLTPEAGKALLNTGTELSRDGRTALVNWTEPQPRGRQLRRLALIDTATGERRILTPDNAEHHYGAARFAPDGAAIAAVSHFDGAYDDPRDSTLWLIDTATGAARDLLPDHELWPREIAWTADGGAVLFVADEAGRRPVFRVEVDGGAVTRLTGDHGAYSALNPARDGTALYALRDAFDAPPAPVRLTPAAADQQPTALRSPLEPLELPGSLTEIDTTADDGTTIRSWLVLPADAAPGSPAPLVVWVHGGPYMSFNGWSWRWNPWLLAERGYAVLLPDPALSTGYGQDMLRRAWGDWGPRTFADVMAITDAAEAREDIDATRTSMMGGSFGGYMANWIAGHTARFKAIVSHASLWALDSFAPVTDSPPVWECEFGEQHTRPERYLRNTPHRHVAEIRTPMLVIHGDKDYRVPIGEGLRLWWDLVEHEVDAKFLYFPDENHWILTPGNIGVWYETVFAFLDHHVHGKEWRRPDLL
ncbi:dipeptidyl aminopeptidase/acylaminoacyl peptidase [Murinocardiopsis flavida]|uniref:Dipeptidyl aminopeptidase/acylaminoacyl peptidase n=1 Tax=Murinocardiopsis flavida TaxID=645275 RepID=A0A2P8CGV9_9ACTN|nr:alpha/beta fold hydrolase [Murinocardiopsis flavida]PSK84210.1 dipeptidyl aminopeptidase/acylaminoacyl peptidase [Murinocardiopsis flavida]